MFASQANCDSSPSNASECPTCGLRAEGIRCPRCHALKVRGCDGACMRCLFNKKDPPPAC